MIDLVEMRALGWDDNTAGGRGPERDPGRVRRAAAAARERLLEAAVRGRRGAAREVRRRRADRDRGAAGGVAPWLIERRFAPVLCGSAFRNKGVQPLLDAVVDLLPSPIDVRPVEGQTPKGEPVTRRAADDEPFAALVFKIMSDPFVGHLAFVRVYSGAMHGGRTSTAASKDRASASVGC